MEFAKIGSRGSLVKKVQNALGLKEDGIFGRMTEAGIKNFQRKNNLFPDGKIDSLLLQALFGDEISTDLSEMYSHVGDLHIINHMLPPGEYVDEVQQNKNYIFIHHTSGWHNPYDTVYGWANDRRGRVGTHYVIGGKNHRTGDFTYDGTVLQCIPDDNWGYHLGDVSKILHQQSVGVELCSFGALQKKGNKYYTWIGTQVSVDQVCTLDFEFRGTKYYHKYSDEQLESLQNLLLHLSQKYNIDLTIGLKERLLEVGEKFAFEYFEGDSLGRTYGLMSHSNVKKTKSDAYPDPDLIKMILKF